MRVVVVMAAFLTAAGCGRKDSSDSKEALTPTPTETPPVTEDSATDPKCDEATDATCSTVDVSALSADDPPIPDEHAADVYALWKSMLLDKAGITEADFDDDLSVVAVSRDSSRSTEHIDISLVVHIDWLIGPIESRVTIPVDGNKDGHDSTWTDVEGFVGDALREFPLHDLGLVCQSDLAVALAECEKQLGAPVGALVIDACALGTTEWADGKDNELRISARGVVSIDRNECGQALVGVESGALILCDVAACMSE
jgi:hypothetical protein